MNQDVDDAYSKEFEALESILGDQVLANRSCDLNSSDREFGPSKVLIETYCMGLRCEKNLVDSIPCLSSADQTKFIVFLNDLDSKLFTKSTLFNLANTAESVSPAC